MTSEPESSAPSSIEQIRKGLGKVYFLRHLVQIRAMLEDGYTVTAVWEDLRGKGQMPIRYNQFRLYCLYFVRGGERPAQAASPNDVAPPPAEPEPLLAIAPRPPGVGDGHVPAGKVPVQVPQHVNRPAPSTELLEGWTGEPDEHLLPHSPSPSRGKT